jgi:predicted negative regulator of RcsB-dependent stress response
MSDYETIKKYVNDPNRDKHEDKKEDIAKLVNKNWSNGDFRKVLFLDGDFLSLQFHPDKNINTNKYTVVFHNINSALEIVKEGDDWMNKTKNFVVNNKGTLATSALLGTVLMAYNRYQKNKSMKKERESTGSRKSLSRKTRSKSRSRTLSRKPYSVII